MLNKLSAESLRQIELWQDDEKLLLEGAKKKVTPCGEQPAEVIIVAHDETVAICYALSYRECLDRVACYILRQPTFLRELPTVPLPHEQLLALYYGAYVVREPTVIFHLGLGEGAPKATYLVCHPDFPANYPIGFGNEKDLEQALRTPHRLPVHR